MATEYKEAISDGVALGRLAGRITAAGLVLYVISVIYRAGVERATIILCGIGILYAVTSLLRDLRYGLTPWAPVEWTSLSPSELPAGEYQRALRWTIALKSLLFVGAVSGLVVVFTAGLKTLGYVLLIGGAPVQIATLAQHYLNGTKPWYPSVPSRPDRPKSE